MCLDISHVTDMDLVLPGGFAHSHPVRCFSCFFCDHDLLVHKKPIVCTPHVCFKTTGTIVAAIHVFEVKIALDYQVMHTKSSSYVQSCC
jgi:hypothetical protein